MTQAKHAVVREWLEGEIHRGRFAVGDKLPTEKQLMEQFSVSRNPVQKAMEGLVEAGIVTRRRGAGSVVASAGLRGNLLRVLDTELTEPEVEGAHAVKSVRIASSETVPLAADRMPQHSPVAEITRTKLDASEEPLALERCVVDLGHAPDILTEDLTVLTTTAYYNGLGMSVRHMSSVLSAVHMSPEDARALGVTTNTPILRQVRTVYLSDGTPVEIAEFFFHPTNITMEVSQLEAKR